MRHRILSSLCVSVRILFKSESVRFAEEDHLIIYQYNQPLRRRILTSFCVSVRILSDFHYHQITNSYDLLSDHHHSPVNWSSNWFLSLCLCVSFLSLCLCVSLCRDPLPFTAPFLLIVRVCVPSIRPGIPLLNSAEEDHLLSRSDAADWVGQILSGSDSAEEDHRITYQYDQPLRRRILTYFCVSVRILSDFHCHQITNSYVLLSDHHRSPVNWSSNWRFFCLSACLFLLYRALCPLLRLSC